MSGPEVSPSQAPAPATAAEARDSTPSRDDGIPIMPVTSASGAPGPAGAPIRPLPRPSDFGHSGGGRGPSKSSKGGGGRLGARPVVFRSTWQEVSFVFMATAATMTSSFLTGATTIITASIGRDLGMTQGQMTWITASAALSAGAVQLALGQLADLLGRKATLTSGLAAFAVLAVVTGFARDPYWMDVFCGLLGVCSALVVPPAIGIMGAAYDRPSRRKNLAFSAFSAGNPLGFVFGSIASGVAARLFNWRAVFYLLGILWAALAVFALWAVPRVEAFGHHQGEEEGEGGGGGGSKKFTVRRRLVVFMRTFDWVGAVFTLFGTGLFAAAVTLGPADGWKSAHVIAMLVIGIALLVLFVFWENFYEHPLMPPHIWKDRNFSLLIIVMVFGFMAFNSGAFWLSLYMQQVLRFDALTVAVHLLPQCIAGLIWNIVAGSLLHRVNNTILMAVGAVSYFAASLLLSFNKLDSSYWAFFFPSLVLMVVGADFQFNVANMYVMQSLPSHKQGLAGGIFNTTIKLATTVALGVSTAVYSSVERTTEGMEDPVVKYTRAWQVSIAFSAVGLLAVPFLRIGTQGNATHDDDNGDAMEATGLSELEPSTVKTSEKKRTDMA